jgi:DMSO/TMAO reductase YedYZ molybdopterin-dependent catalytic subunit
MKNMLRKIIPVLLLGALLLTACGSAPNVDWTLKISGAVSNPVEYSYKELTKMEEKDLSDILMDKSIGEDEITSWSGVPLETLLAEADADEDFVSITALAADGYAIEISSAEAEGAIVALKTEGEWIQNVDPDSGPMRLVCPETPANRWVFQLEEIQVNK